jgi:hypothetical protein
MKYYLYQKRILVVISEDSSLGILYNALKSVVGHDPNLGDIEEMNKEQLQRWVKSSTVKITNSPGGLKSVEDWLREIPDAHVADCAIKNRRSYLARNNTTADPLAKAVSIVDALQQAFNWHSSPEGGRYWSQLRDHYSDNS